MPEDNKTELAAHVAKFDQAVARIAALEAAQATAKTDLAAAVTAATADGYNRGALKAIELFGEKFATTVAGKPSGEPVPPTTAKTYEDIVKAKFAETKSAVAAHKFASSKHEQEYADYIRRGAPYINLK